MEKKEQAIPQARTADIVTRDLPDEVLVYDLNNHKAHCLNHTAATVWKYCDGKATVPEITARLKSDHQLAADDATVWLAVNRLSKANLLQERVTPPAESGRMGRRAALRIGTAIAVPLVMSIIAPTAQAACTGTGLSNGTACCANSQCASGCCDRGVTPDVCAAVGAGTVLPGMACANPGNCCSTICVGTPGSMTCAGT